MTKDEMTALNRGNIVRHKGNKRTYVVTSNYGNRVTAVDSADITNPDEWELVEVYCHKREQVTTYFKF